ncbi:MAG: hypothetical protein KJ731_03035 [Alphaproteobacteria bacterium]|nr:hypothetical protein [Alphaproteobacteria bacterium]
MELRYPINFIGHEEGATKGDVLTRDGEYLGTWFFYGDDESGDFHFVADGETEPMFSEGVSFRRSGLLEGMALSSICRSIREWFEESDSSQESIGEKD